jgi:hypothetical protein
MSGQALGILGSPCRSPRRTPLIISFLELAGHASEREDEYRCADARSVWMHPHQPSGSVIQSRYAPALIFCGASLSIGSEHPVLCPPWRESIGRVWAFRRRSLLTSRGPRELWEVTRSIVRFQSASNASVKDAISFQVAHHSGTRLKTASARFSIRSDPSRWNQCPSIPPILHLMNEWKAFPYRIRSVIEHDYLKRPLRALYRGGQPRNDLRDMPTHFFLWQNRKLFQ